MKRHAMHDAYGLFIQSLSESSIRIRADAVTLYGEGSVAVENVDLVLYPDLDGWVDEWKYIWLVFDGDVSAVLSIDEPEGAYVGLIGAVFNKHTKGIREFLQRGIFVDVPQWLTVDEGTAKSFKRVDLSKRVPANAVAAKFQVVLRNDGQAASCSITLAPNGEGTDADLSSTTHVFPGLSSTYRFTVDLINLLEPQSIYYRLGCSGSAEVVADEINVRGWRY